MYYKEKVIHTCSGCGKPITDTQSFWMVGHIPVCGKKCFSLYEEKKTDVPKTG